MGFRGYTKGLGTTGANERGRQKRGKAYLRGAGLRKFEEASKRREFMKKTKQQQLGSGLSTGRSEMFWKILGRIHATAESESRGLWEEQVPSQVWVAHARKSLTCSTGKERRNRNIGAYPDAVGIEAEIPSETGEPTRAQGRRCSMVSRSEQ